MNATQSIPWNLDKPDAPVAFVPPTGTRREQGEEILRRCRERDTRLEQQAIEAERAGDEQGCWFAMATRAENQRAIDMIKKDLENLP